MLTNSTNETGNALIFMTAHDCEMYVAQSLSSLARQTHDELHVLFVDDHSQDDTGTIAQGLLQDLFPGRHTFVRNDARWGKARNIWEHLRPRIRQAEFVAILDGDDQLLDQDIVGRMAASYRSGRDVVWTNYVTDKGAVGGNATLDPDRPPRQQGWKTSHFFSFRAQLLESVPQEYFKNHEGQWLPAACDMALAFPILDQTRRYEFLPVNAYRYTSSNPCSHHNQDSAAQGLNSTIQRECAREVLAKPALARIDVVSEVASGVHPAQSAAAAETDVWGGAVADAIVAACPPILDALAVGPQPAPSPMQAWALRRAALNAGPSPRILHLGSSRSTAVLAAIASTLGGRLSCLCTSMSDARAVLSRLAACGLAADVRIMTAGTVSLGFEEFSGDLPSTEVLGSDAEFDLVVTDASDGAMSDGAALVSLPALVGRLSPQGFTFCLLASTPTLQDMAADRWERACGELLFCRDAVGPSGLMVIGSH